MKPFAIALLFVGSTWASSVLAACTKEFKPVCGYWMHTSKTQTFINECQMREFGAKERHKGSCKDQPTKPVSAPPEPAKK